MGLFIRKNFDSNVSPFFFNSALREREREKEREKKYRLSKNEKEWRELRRVSVLILLEYNVRRTKYVNDLIKSMAMKRPVLK